MPIYTYNGNKYDISDSEVALFEMTMPGAVREGAETSAPRPTKMERPSPLAPEGYTPPTREKEEGAPVKMERPAPLALEPIASVDNSLYDEGNETKGGLYEGTITPNWGTREENTLPANYTLNKKKEELANVKAKFESTTHPYTAMGYKEKMDAIQSEIDVLEGKKAKSPLEELIKSEEEKLAEMQKEEAEKGTTLEKVIHGINRVALPVASEIPNRLTSAIVDYFDDSKEGRERSALRHRIETQEKKIDLLQNLQNKEEDYDNIIGDAARFLRHTGQSLGEYVGDFVTSLGFNNLYDASRQYKVYDKLENGQQLTAEEEKSLYDDYVLATLEQQIDLGKAAKFGDMTGTSLGFMMEFIGTAGATAIPGVAKASGTFGAKKFTEIAVKRAANRALARGVTYQGSAAANLVENGIFSTIAKHGWKNGLKESYQALGIRGIGELAATKTLGTGIDIAMIKAPAMTFTVGAGKTASSVMETKMGKVGIDGEGQLAYVYDRDWDEAVYEGVLDNIIEYGSEMAGAVLPSGKMSSVALQRALPEKLAKVLSPTKLTGMILRNPERAAVIAAKTDAALAAAGMHGILPEIYEEYLGQGARTIAGLSTAYTTDEKGNVINNLESGKWHRELWEGMALTVGLTQAVTGLGVGAANKYQMKSNLNNAEAAAAALFTPEEWEQIRAVTDAVGVGDMMNYLTTVRQTSEYSAAQKNAIMNYAGRLLEWRGFNLGQVAQARSKKEHKTSEDEDYIAYDRGYQTTGSKTSDVESMYQTQRAQVESVLGTTEVDDATLRQQAARAREEGRDEVADLLLDYNAALQARNGMTQRQKDEVELEVTRVTSNIDAYANTDGNVVRVRTKGAEQEDEKEEAKDFVINGTIVRNQDGTINKNESSESVIVRNGTTGEKRSVSIDEILAVEEQVSAEEKKAQARAEIEQNRERGFELLRRGVHNPSAGERYLVPFEGNLIEVEVQANEEGQTIDEQGNVFVTDGQKAGTVPINFIYRAQEHAQHQRTQEKIAQMQEQREKNRAQRGFERVKNLRTDDRVTMPNGRQLLVVENTGDGLVLDGEVDGRYSGNHEMSYEDLANRLGYTKVEESSAVTPQQQVAQPQFPTPQTQQQETQQTQQEQPAPQVQQTAPMTSVEEAKAMIEETEGDVDMAVETARELAQEAATKAEQLVKTAPNTEGMSAQEKIAVKKAHKAEIARLQAEAARWNEVADIITNGTQTKQVEKTHNELVRERVAEWSAKLGVPITVIERKEDVTNQQALEEMKNGRVRGWYEHGKGAVVYAPGISVEEVDEVVIHEVVAHHGIRGLFANEEDYHRMLDSVWKAMAPEARTFYMNYAGVKDEHGAVEEFIAHLAEKTDFTDAERTIWQHIMNWLKQLFVETPMTEEQLTMIIRGAYAKMRQEAEAKVQEMQKQEEQNSATNSTTVEESSAPRTQNLQGKDTKSSDKNAKFSAREKTEGSVANNTQNTVIESEENGNFANNNILNISQDEYTDEFRRIQAESLGLSGEALRKYHKGEYKNSDGRIVPSFGDEDRRRLGGIHERLLSRGNDVWTNYGLDLEGKGNTFRLVQVNGSLFHDIFEVNRNYLPNGELVDLHDDYTDCKCFLSDDGLCGFAIESNGNLVSVFSLNPSDKNGFLYAIKDFIRSEGATHLDCYASNNQNLLVIYEKTLRFYPASTMDYNMEYDHDDIAKNHGMPNIVFMVDHKVDEVKHFDKDSYEEAVAYQQSQINNDSSETRFSARPSQADLDAIAEEEAQIIAEAKNNGTYLKAPNGKDTNLSPEQWVRVRTKRFKEWFGDWENDPENASKVVDENGEPLVVYHGTTTSKRFAEFREGMTFHASNPNVAAHWSGTSSPTRFKETLLSELNDIASWEALRDFARNELGISIERIDGEVTQAEAKEYGIKAGKTFGYSMVYPGGVSTSHGAIGSVETEAQFVDHLKNMLNGEVYRVTLDEKMRGRSFTYADFVNARKPIEVDARGSKWFAIPFEGKNLTAEDIAYLAHKRGYDSVVIKNVKETDYADRLTDDIISFSPTQIKSATDNVGTYANETNDIRFSFIGEQGAKALDAAEEATIRLDNLAVARDMEADGKDALAIKMATGWERGADGKWRYETEDVKLKKDFWKKKDVTLGDVADLGELGKAYPDLKDIKVVLDTNESERRGTYSHKNNTITLYIMDANNTRKIAGAISRNIPFTKRIADYMTSSAKESVDKTLVHEIQHAIQSREGFAKGGNKRMRIGESEERLGYEGYRKLAGEVEARNVSERMGMSMEERRASLRTETQDVADEDQIFIYEGLEGANTMFSRLENLDAVNDRFNEELQKQIDGTLPTGHIYQLGMPSYILRATGIAYAPIQMNSNRLLDKATSFGHDYELHEVKDLVKALQNPIAIFSYGDSKKAQNVVVEIQHGGKNFIVGISIRPNVKGQTLEINSVRNVFPKDNAEWLNWVSQGKALYLDKEKIQAVINQQRTNLADVKYLDLDYIAKVVESFENPQILGQENESVGENSYLEEGAVRFSVVTDPKEIAFFENSEKIIGYRNMVMREDGSLGSPMASGLRTKGKKQVKTDFVRLGEIEKAEENPDLADENGKVDLVKPDGKSVGGVDYNPYIHNRPDKVNTQFKQAWERDNLVYVECEIAKDDLAEGYHADKAKLSVGVHDWSGGGKLILSRYDKPVRIVHWEEVADDWMAHFGDKGIHFDIIPPKLLPILAERGANIIAPHKGMGKACNDAYEQWNEQNGRTMFSSVPGSLVAMHNLTASNLDHVVKMGGIANPSMAVVDSDIATLDNFGEITLIAPRDLIEKKLGKNAGTWAADAYTPRYPQVEYVIPYKKERELIKRAEAAGVDSYGAAASIQQIQQSGKRWLNGDKTIQKMFAHEGKPGETIDQYIDRLMDEAVEKEQIFMGYTDYGRKYAKHTLANVSRIMKKEGRAGAETNFGVGSVRAKLTPIFKTIAQIQKNKDRIVSKEEWKEAVESINKRYHDLVDETRTGSNDWNADVRLGEALLERDPKKYLKDEYSIEITDDVAQEIKQLAADLSVMPTEYFETKFERPVMLNEFVGAIIPENASERTRKILNDAGIPYAEYDSGKEGDRLKVTQEYTKQLEEEVGGVRFSVAPSAPMLNDVAKRGLKDMFGKNYNTFVQEVYQDLPVAERKNIATAAAKIGWDFPRATEQYLASLANDEVFSNMSPDVWQQIRDRFNEMISEGEYSNNVLNNNDLRYALWRNAENAREKVHESPLAFASDVVAKDDLARSKAEPGTRLSVIPVRDVQKEYEERMKSSAFQVREALQDSMLSLRDAMLLIKPVGHIEEIEGWQNAYLGENRLSSVNKEDSEQFVKRFVRPMLNAASLLAPNDASYAELIDYMFAKHGVERNDYMRRMEIMRIQAMTDEELNGRLRSDLIASAQKRDYAGLTQLTGESDVTIAEQKAMDMVNAYEASQNKVFVNNLWNSVNAANTAVLEKLVETGMMSRRTFNKIKKMYKFYIPLQGFDDSTAEDEYAYIDEKDSTFTKPIFIPTEGRDTKADNPFVYIQSMAESAIVQGNRNKLVKQRFLRFAQNNPSDLVSINKLWMRLNRVTGEWEAVFPTNITDLDTPEQVEAKMEQWEKDMRENAKNFPDEFRLHEQDEHIPFKVVQDRHLRQHQVVVMKNGIPVVMTINGNPRLAQALNGLTNPDHSGSGARHKAFSALESMNRFLSTAYTQRNLDFVISNFSRDMIYTNSMVWVKEPKEYAAKFNANIAVVLVSIRSLYKDYESDSLDTSKEMQRYFQEFMRNGGETGYTALRNVEKHREDIEKELRKLQGEKTPFKDAMEWIDRKNRYIENIARFAAYMTSRQSGRSIDRSIFDAKEISVNFNKKGAQDRFLDAHGQTSIGNLAALGAGWGSGLYVFWNAAMQGSANYLRATTRNPGKAMLVQLAPTFLFGFMVPILIGAFGDDDDKEAYYNLPESVRRGNFCFPIGGGKFLTIPLPIEYKAMYGIAEMFGSVASGGVKMDGKEMGLALLGQMSGMLPLDVTKGGWVSLAPSSIKPFIELGINKSWTGLPIYKGQSWWSSKKDKYSYVPEYQKGFKSTSWIATEASELLNDWTGGNAYKPGLVDINPAAFEHLLNSFFGGYVNTPMKIMTSAANAYDMATKDDAEFDPRKWLFVNRLVKKGNDQTENRNINNQYWKLCDDMEAVKYQYKGYKRDNRLGIEDYSEELQKMKDEKVPKKIEIFDQYQSKINKHYSKINKNPDKPEKIKEWEMKILNNKRKLLQRLKEIDEGK